MNGSGVKVLLRPTIEAMAETAADECEAVLREALALRGRASMVATGGSTPGPLYDRLSRTALDWSKISVTLSDERCVPPDHPDSNERMVRARLLKGPAAAARFLPLKGDGEPDKDAAAASAALALLPRPFDLVVLGMGDDGHIASLFPGSPVLARALDETDQDLVIDVPPGNGRAPAQPRLSLTLQALKSAGRVILLFSGRRKFDVLEAALQSPDPYLYPVCAILGARGGVRVICAS
jgi:6-phosphogluconolactonase